MNQWNSNKGIVTGAPNDTQHQNNAHSKTSNIDCDGGAADQCAMSQGAYINFMIQRKLNYIAEMYT